jgi:aerobic carbon-monoxide dehydrogenase medium subunit
VGVIEYFRPASVSDAIELLGRHGPELLVLAGGTITMPLINDGISAPRRVMSLRAAGLDSLDLAQDQARIGATCPLQRLLELDELPLLAEAARQTGSWAIRNMGTVGGNLFAPPPAGDITVALLALDAWLLLAGPDVVRDVSIASFHTGFMTTALRPDEIVTEIRVPTPRGVTAFRKLGRRQASTPSVVTVAARIEQRAGQVTAARVALGAVGPHPYRSSAAEAALVGGPLDATAIARAADAAADSTDPVTDGIATDWYRRRMARVVVEQTLTDITTRMGDPA